MAVHASEIKHFVLERIRKGKLKPGDRVPSRSELEARFGCARATVDRALSELKREKVLRSEFGRGTFVASAPAKERKAGGRLAVVLQSTRGFRSDLYVFGIYRELARTLTELGDKPHDTIEEFHSPSGAGWRALTRASMVYWIRPAPSAVPVMKALELEGVPQVMLNRNYSDLPCIVTDAAAGQREAIRHLIELGHRRIGYIHSPPDPLRAFDSERMIGFLEGVHASGLAPDAAPRLELDKSIKKRDRAIASWLASPEAPTAVLASSNLAAPILRGAEIAGLRIPVDLSVLTIDEVHDPNDLLGLRFTCQRQRLGKMGRRAARLDPGALNTDAGPLKILLAPELIPGDTTVAPRARRSVRKKRAKAPD